MILVSATASYIVCIVRIRDAYRAHIRYQFSLPHLIRLPEPTVELRRHLRALAHEFHIRYEAMAPDDAAAHDRGKTPVSIVHLAFLEEPVLHCGKRTVGKV